RLRHPPPTLFPYTTLFRSRRRETFRLGDCPRGVDQADVAERLREVAEHLARAWLDFLGEQADVVGERDRLLEDASGAVDLTGLRSEEHTSELQSPDHLVCR